jgi:hypothetical protein
MLSHFWLNRLGRMRSHSTFPGFLQTPVLPLTRLVNPPHTCSASDVLHVNCVVVAKIESWRLGGLAGDFL